MERPVALTLAQFKGTGIVNAGAAGAWWYAEIDRPATERQVAALDSAIAVRVDTAREPDASLRALVSRKRDLETADHNTGFDWAIVWIVCASLLLAGQVGLAEVRRREADRESDARE